MRPGLNRDLVRERTAYKLGRSLVDGFLIAQLLLTLAVIIGVCVYQSRLPALNAYYTAGVICGAVVLCAAAVLQRELFQAFFDIADRALIGATTSALDENPFKQPR